MQTQEITDTRAGSWLDVMSGWLSSRDLEERQDEGRGERTSVSDLDAPTSLVEEAPSPFPRIFPGL